MIITTQNNSILFEIANYISNPYKCRNLIILDDFYVINAYKNKIMFSHARHNNYIYFYKKKHYYSIELWRYSTTIYLVYNNIYKTIEYDHYNIYNYIYSLFIVNKRCKNNGCKYYHNTILYYINSIHQIKFVNLCRLYSINLFI